MKLVPDPPGRIVRGSVLLDGADVLTMGARELRAVRGGRIAMVFQDPFSSLNPTMTLGAQIIEAIQAHAPLGGRQAHERAVELLRAVHMPEPEMRMRRYPHQVSGGQRQRVMVAMAFACNPDLIIADEPTTALDVTVQAQVLALMTDLCERTGAAILLITHDLGIVAETCGRMMVMYAGRIVEEGSVEDVFRAPRHPYTEGLLASLPDMTGPRRPRLPSIPGQPPALTDEQPGCRFADRCPKVMEVCRTAEPDRALLDGGDAASPRAARCHLLAGPPST
jgi:peptide/nickel transport system ATP-binding protein